MLLVVQQNTSRESFQSAFREVLDPQIVLSLRDQIRSLRREMELNHGLQAEQHNLVRSEMESQSEQARILLEVLRQHISQPIIDSHERELTEARESHRSIPIASAESCQRVDADEVSLKAPLELENIDVMKEKLRAM